ncbi:MAG: ribokinase, partial [Actinomycetota bacterium]|nr:ribokinase [Actinomycetota bacterium]
YLLGKVGEDYFGDFMVESLRNAGIDPTMVKRDEKSSTGVALIVVDEKMGLSTIVVDPGANMDVSVEDLNCLEEVLESVHTALFQLEIPVDVVVEGARRAKKRGARTILDAGPPREVEREVLEPFDIVSPNLDELSHLSGKRIDGVEQACSVAREMIGEKDHVFVVKMGDMGSVVVTREEAWHIPPFEINAIDATAAGDAFTAALAVALGEGKDLIEATLFANAAGALATTVVGALPSMPERAGVLKLLSSGKIFPRRIEGKVN